MWSKAKGASEGSEADAWPEEWKIILLIDKKLTGIHGKEEVNEFKTLKKIDTNYALQNCNM